MASLISPGVSVTVTDESFYAPAGTGTIPLIVIATAQDKAAPDGSGIAPYTTAETAGKLQLITSQRELVTNYGMPIFKTFNGTALNGNELNEYGLLAAYSFLGVANRAYVLRADVDLGALSASASEPTGTPASGAYWLDTANTVWGLKKWNGTTWVRQTVRVPSSAQITTSAEPKGSFGLDGDFAVVYTDDTGATLDTITIYQKQSSAWTVVGSSLWIAANPTLDFYVSSYLTLPSSGLTSGDLLLQMDMPNNGTSIAVSVYDGITGQYTSQSIVGKLTEEAITAIYPTGTSPAEGDLWADYDPDQAVIYLKRYNGDATLAVTGSVLNANLNINAHIANTSQVAFTINTVTDNISVNVKLTTGTNISGNVYALSADIVEDINSALSDASVATLEASVVSGLIVITSSDGAGFTIENGNVPVFDVDADLGFTAQDYSNWEILSYEANSAGATGTPAEGTLWYDNLVNSTKVDIMYNDDGSWADYAGTVFVSATNPATGVSGFDATYTEALWVDSSDLENFPVIYKRSSSNTWVQIDNTDQVSADGILFADFRSVKGGSLDTDAPDPALYPYGILAWNKRVSGGNIKQYTNGIWVDYSGNRADGSPYMLRKAQRNAVVRSMQASINSNDDLKSELNRYNLMVCPGYIEVLDELISLNTSRKETAFILADAPMRLAPTGTAIQNWATNASGAASNGEEGLVSSSAYAAVYYPHAFTSTALDGYDVMVPATHVALRTLAYSDQVSYPWFAPAGYQRGIVTNATSTGYLNGTTGEYVTVSLSEGQRDTLYENKINPIGNFPGRGIVVFGQKTLSPTASALDRINVARLVVYLRERLDDAVRPFLFEPNDEVTRTNAKSVVDRLLDQLVTQRGLYDFVTVCDTSNNTPARIDRNELHIDVAIQPTKAVEFIYIPLRIQSTQG